MELLAKLSYRSQLGLSLKNNLHCFDEDALFAELEKVTAWFANSNFLHDIAISFRIKSVQSARLKYDRYYPDRQARKVFNDMLGFRTLCDDYDEVIAFAACECIRIADMSAGKALDDGYRGVHVYFQLDNFHYPIEIHYNTCHDRQLNDWLHQYLCDLLPPLTEVGASCFNHYCLKVRSPHQQVLHSVHKR
jgi:putative GTP pyrophosphokinase